MLFLRGSAQKKEKATGFYVAQRLYYVYQTEAIKFVH